MSLPGEGPHAGGDRPQSEGRPAADGLAMDLPGRVGGGDTSPSAVDANAAVLP